MGENMYSSASDKTQPNLVAEFDIPWPVLSISVLPDNEIALFSAASAYTVKLFNYRTKSVRQLSYTFPLSMLATSLDKYDKFIFSTLSNIQIEANAIAGFRDGTFIPYQTRLRDLISLHITENKFIAQTSNGIVIVDQNKEKNGEQVIKPERFITNLPQRYFLAALDDHLVAIGFGQKVFILDLNANRLRYQFAIHGEIQALARLNQGKLAIGMVEQEIRGTATRSKSFIDLSSMDEIPMDEIMHVEHHTRLNAVDVYDVNTRTTDHLIHWSNSMKINVLAASYAGDRLIVGFEDGSTTAQAYTEIDSGSTAAGDLHLWNPPKILHKTHFKVYELSKMDKT